MLAVCIPVIHFELTGEFGLILCEVFQCNSCTKFWNVIIFGMTLFGPCVHLPETLYNIHTFEIQTVWAFINTWWGRIFRNSRQVHRLLNYQFFMMYLLVLYPIPFLNKWLDWFPVAEGRLLLVSDELSYTPRSGTNLYVYQLVFSLAKMKRSSHS